MVRHVPPSENHAHRVEHTEFIVLATRCEVAFDRADDLPIVHARRDGPRLAATALPKQ